MGRVLFLVNHDIVTYNFCKELVERLIHDGCEVVVSSPLVRMGCRHCEVEMDRHGRNILRELKLLRPAKSPSWPT